MCLWDVWREVRKQRSASELIFSLSVEARAGPLQVIETILYLSPRLPPLQPQIGSHLTLKHPPNSSQSIIAMPGWHETSNYFLDTSMYVLDP